MLQFGTSEVSRLADIPIHSIRAMVRARYVSPAKSPRGALRFSFQDVVLLRTARHLLAARISPRRIGTALRAVSAQLPADLPARGLSITAAGGRVVVHEVGARQRDAVTGQLLLAFEVRPHGDALRMVDTLPAPGAAEATGDCTQDFEAALALEDRDVDAAVEAYRACLARHSHGGAAANLGRLLHLQGYITEAVALYREVAEPDVDILYNLAVALEDLGHTEAIETYERVLQLDPDNEDAHHNVARLWQQAGNEKLALRHWNAYRRLARQPPAGG